MKKLLLLAAFLLAAGSSPSLAVTVTSPGTAMKAAMPAPQAANIERVRYTDRYYGQRWWWGYLKKPHGHCLRVYKSRYVKGCGKYNCYSGKWGWRNKVAKSGGHRHWDDQFYQYPYTRTYPEYGFGIVVH